MSKILHLVLSDDTFGGFEHFFILTKEVYKIEDIIDSIINRLRNVLHYNNMEVALTILNGKHFHIHDVSINDLHNYEVSDIIYVCSHKS